MVVMLLLAHCLLLPPVFVVFCVWSLFCFAVSNVELNAGEEKHFWLLFDGATGWSALCKGGIAWSYSLTFY